MGKILYETTLLVCSSCVIFTGTVSAVLLMLAWPNDRILGLSTRMVIGVSDIRRRAHHRTLTMPPNV